MNAPKFINLAVKSAVALAFSAGIAQAATFQSYLVGGSNGVEDDSNEFVFRPNVTNGGYSLITSGNIQNGDIIAQVLDYGIINGVNIDSNGDELTGIALNVVSNLVSAGNQVTTASSGLIVYPAINFSMTAATAADWQNLLGIDITNTGLGALFDTTNLISLMFFDNNNNLNLFTQNLANSLANVLDGTLTFGLTLDSNDGDYLSAFNVPGDPSQFLVGDVGTTQYGLFGGVLSSTYENLAYDVDKVALSGTNLVPDAQRRLITPVIDDTQGTFNYVPEPGTLALLGMGLLGLGFSSRRRKI